MNRTLTTVLAVVAVVGATSGTVVARALVDEPAPAGRAAEAPRSDERADQVLWATRDGIHDGDQVVRVRLPGPPVALQRAADGWVVSTVRDTEDRSTRQTAVISPDGEVRPLAETYGAGDVAPDGASYVAQALDGSGYGVWDLASGERVETIEVGRDAGQAVGGAQFVDLDTVGTTWAGTDGDQEVLISDRESSEPSDAAVLADDVFGPWAISPDGRWFAGSLLEVEDGESRPGCVVVRPVDRSDEGRLDCGGRFPGHPSFASDSSAVLTVPPYEVLMAEDRDDYYFRPVPTGDSPAPQPVPTPNSGFDGVMLGPGEVVSLGEEDEADGPAFSVGEGLLDDLGMSPTSGAEPQPEPEPEPDYAADPDAGLLTVVQRCAVGAGCEVVGQAEGYFGYAVLGAPF